MFLVHNFDAQSFLAYYTQACNFTSMIFQRGKWKKQRDAQEKQ